MTCWIIHWAFAGEQMEGQTHTRTCSLADSYTLVHSCIYLYTHMHIFKYLWTHTPSLHTPGVLCLPVSLTGCWHLGCFTSAPPLYTDTTIQPTYYQKTEKKSYQKVLSPLFLTINTDFILFYHHFRVLCITLDLLSMCLYFKHNCQATGIRMQLYYTQIIDHLKQRSTVRV